MGIGKRLWYSHWTIGEVATWMSDQIGRVDFVGGFRTDGERLVFLVET